jgi:hypothetical protein
MSIRWTTILLALMATGRADADPLPGAELLVLDNYGDTQLPAHYRTGWWAICPGDPAHLQPATVTRRSVPDDVGPTFRVSAAPCTDALFLVRAKGGLSAREVPTATWTTVGHGLSKEVEITLGSQRTQLRVRGAPEHDQWLEVGDQRPQKIRLARAEDEWHLDDWKLVWAGDLDGDGALDFVVREMGDGDGVELFLSSRAKPGKRVGKAASTSFGGC